MEIPKHIEEYLSSKLEHSRRVLMEISSKSSRQEMFNYLTKEIAQVFEATGSALYTYDSTLDELTLVAVYNLRQELSGIRMKVDHGLLSKVARGLQAMKVDDYSRWPERINVFEEDHYKALLEAPIIWKGKLLGIIGLVRTSDARPFGGFDLNLLSMVALQLGAFLDPLSTEGRPIS